MKNQKLKARIRYEMNGDREGYAIHIKDLETGEWGLESWFPLVAKEGGNGENNFIHWTFLVKLNELQTFGYDIDLMF